MPHFAVSYLQPAKGCTIMNSNTYCPLMSCIIDIHKKTQSKTTAMAIQEEEGCCFSLVKTNVIEVLHDLSKNIGHDGAIFTAGNVTWDFFALVNTGRYVWVIFVCSVCIFIKIGCHLNINFCPWLDSQHMFCFYLLTGHNNYATNTLHGEVAISIG